MAWWLNDEHQRLIWRQQISPSVLKIGWAIKMNDRQDQRQHYLNWMECRMEGRCQERSRGHWEEQCLQVYQVSLQPQREGLWCAVISVLTLWWALHGLCGYIWASGGPRDTEGRTDMYRTCVTNFFCVSLGRQTRINLLSLGLLGIHLPHLRVVWTYLWWSEHPMVEVDTSLQGGVRILECNINAFSLS